MRRPLLAAAVLALLTMLAAPPAFAAPTLQVSATEGLEDGQTITVDGSGFASGLKGIAVGQCRVGYKGPSDCNTSGGATFRNADADGAFPRVTIKLATSFSDIDCTKEQCIIAAAPLPTNSGPEEVRANTVEIPLYFGDAAPVEAAPAASTAPPVQTLAPAATGAVLRADDSDNTALTVLIGTNLVLIGGGLYLGFGRRRTGASR